MNKKQNFWYNYKRRTYEIKNIVINYIYSGGFINLNSSDVSSLAALTADELAKEVDFFSVGSNDLTQYTLALDRCNSSAEKYYDSHHPAVIKLLESVAESAHKNGIKAGICGELASDITMTQTFIEMGYESLSVSVSKLEFFTKR